MPYYENVLIARQDMSQAQVEGLADTLAGVVQELGGAVVKREHWGLKNLAFKMNKNRKGHYVMFNLDAPWPAVAEMERQMRLSEDVLRYLTIRVEAVEEGPSAMMQSKGSRDDRPPRRGDRDRDRGDRGDRERGDRRERDDERREVSADAGDNP